MSGSGISIANYKVQLHRNFTQLCLVVNLFHTMILLEMSMCLTQIWKSLGYLFQHSAIKKLETLFIFKSASIPNKHFSLQN